MKRALAIAFSFGAGVALMGVAALALLSWRASLPQPWNTTSITATFDSVDTEGPEKKLVFYYILQNNRDRDFRITSERELVLTGKLERQQSLTQESSKEFLSGELLVFIPARQRARFAIHLGYSYRGSQPLSGGTAKAERDHDRALIAAYVRDELPNLEGFALFHENTRYQIDLPKGWK